MTAFSLASNTALVTGSSQGIGHAIALGAHRAGARVVFHGKDAATPAMPEGSVYLPGDLLDPDGPARLVAAAFAARPELDLLVCNAGSFFDVPFLEMTPALFERTINLNVRANYFVAQAFARELVARKRPGAIVTTTSTNGFQPEDDSTVYDTSKGAMVMMTRTLAQSLAVHGIRVNSVAPGLIKTPLTAGLLTQYRDFGESNRAHADRAYRWLEGELSNQDYIAGPTYSMADIVALTTVDFGRMIGVAVPEDCSRVLAWLQRVSERPSATA